MSEPLSAPDVRDLDPRKLFLGKERDNDPMDPEIVEGIAGVGGVDVVGEKRPMEGNDDLAEAIERERDRRQERLGGSVEESGSGTTPPLNSRARESEAGMLTGPR